MMGAFAIVPDTSQVPAAFFTELEDAIDWGVSRFGANAFRVRWMELVITAEADKAPANAA